MITITHKMDERGVKFATVKHSDFRLYGFKASSYALGWDKPNYPVPAIRLNKGEKAWHNKIHALNNQAWRVYWYQSGLVYKD